ncbi:MAG: response regulator [Candidatus Latescibacteria bacterium]|jgi:signal transduction histidine kinase|nr:response regulator [Candidatus Latescibacterota bacterium]
MSKRSKILIVDDEPFNLDLLEQELMDDYDIVSATNGIEALEQADAENPDLILLDIQMPEMNGIEAVMKLRESEHHVTTPVFMLTAQSNMEDQVVGLNAGADDYILKPFDPDDLQARIRSGLRIGGLQKELTKERNDLKQALEELKSAEAQLVHSEKMAGLGKLVAGVAHELNNPIGFIYANMGHFSRYIGVLKSICDTAGISGDDAEKAEKSFSTLNRLIESCSNGSQRIKEIVLGLRTFSRLDEAERKSVDLHEGIDSTLTLLEHLFKERITVEKNYGDLPMVECYAGQLNQVFMNLLTNATDAIDGEGKITISTQTNTDSVIISFADTGSGIPKDALSKIFDPFFTTKDIGKGTGLGLSISYGIVEKHGGKIAAESEVDKGTTFTITLPFKMPEGIEDE